MKQFIFLLIIGLIFPLFSFAQNSPTIESLENTTKQHLENLEFEEALLYAKKLCAQLEKKVEKSDSSYLKGLLLLAKSHYFLEDYKSTLKILQSISIKKTEMPELALELNLQEYLVYLQMDENAQKEQALSGIESILAEKGDTGKTAYSDYLFTNAIALWDAQQDNAAEKVLLELQKNLTKSEGKNSPRNLRASNVLAHLYAGIGRKTEAEQLFLQLIQIRESIEEKPSKVYLATLRYLAEFYLHEDKIKEATDIFRKAIKICSETYGEQSTDYAWLVHKWAKLLNSIDKSEEAIANYKKAIKIFEKANGKESSGYTWTLNNMSDAYVNLKQFDKAELSFMEVLALKEKIYGRKHPEYAYTLNSLSNLFFQKGNFEQALLFSLRDIAANSTSWDTLTAITDAFIQQIPDANYQIQYNAFLTIGDLTNISEKLYDKTGDTQWLEKAFKLCQAALKLSEKHKNTLTNEADKFMVLETHGAFAQEAVENSYKLYTKNQSKAYLEAAFLFSEQSKAVVLADALKAQKARQLSNLPDELAILESKLNQELHQLQKSLLEATDATQLQNARTAFTQKTTELDAFKKKIEKEFPTYYGLKYSTSDIKVEQIQSMLTPEAAVLAYQIGDSTSFVFAITKNAFHLIPIEIPLDLLNKNTEILRKNLSDYDFIKNNLTLSYTEFTEKAFWFYQSLMQPALEKCPGVKQLIIVPDNSLGHLPFEVFLSKKAPEKGNFGSLSYLLNDYKISYSYSASLWLENSSSTTSGSGNNFLGMAPSYQFDAGDASITRSPSLVQMRSGIFDLPEAVNEVKMLESVFKGTYFYGMDACETNFKKHATEANIIHLAMHGILNEKNPILSSLVLTENGDSIEDNFLQSFEISHLKLNAQLVVLSACETGYGKFQQGEGVMSLARSFMYAGVPSLVVSMWQVNDQSTSVIMQNFYKNLAKGMDKAEALQQAKLSYIGAVDGIAAHPAFWAPFIQLGDSRPVKIGQESNGIWLWGSIGGIGTLMLGVGAVAMRRKRENG